MTACEPEVSVWADTVEPASSFSWIDGQLYFFVTIDSLGGGPLVLAVSEAAADDLASIVAQARSMALAACIGKDDQVGGTLRLPSVEPGAVVGGCYRHAG